MYIEWDIIKVKTAEKSYSFAVYGWGFGCENGSLSDDLLDGEGKFMDKLKLVG